MSNLLDFSNGFAFVKGIAPCLLTRRLPKKGDLLKHTHTHTSKASPCQCRARVFPSPSSFTKSPVWCVLSKAWCINQLGYNGVSFHIGKPLGNKSYIFDLPILSFVFFPLMIGWWHPRPNHSLFVLSGESKFISSVVLATLIWCWTKRVDPLTRSL